MKKILAIVLLITLVVWGYGKPLAITQARFEKTDTFITTTIDYSDATVREDLSFVDGVKNGAILWGNALRNFFSNFYESYTSGFEGKSIFAAILWGLFGAIWLIFKNLFFLIVTVVVNFFLLLTMKAKLFYYVGFIISVAFVNALVKVVGNEDIDGSSKYSN